MRKPRGPAADSRVWALGGGRMPAPDADFQPLEGSRAPSVLERHLLTSLRANGLPEPEREFRFHDTRRWRLDFAWPERGLAVEVEGGVYRGGGHTSVGGIKRDIEKGNALTLMGWRLLRFHGDQVRSGEATALIAEALAQRWVREV